MEKIDLVKEYVKESDFEIFKKELYKTSYSSFSKIALVNFKLLSTLKEILIIKDFLDQIKKSKNKDYVIVIEIVFFISLIEGYMDNSGYKDLQDYLREEIKKGETITRKEMNRKINEYQNKYSLTSKVKEFIKQAPIFDIKYLESCFEKKPDLPDQKGLRLLVFMIKNSPIETVFHKNEIVKKNDILDEIKNICKNKSGKIPIKDIFNIIKNQKITNEQLKILNDVSEKLYDIRSKFVHNSDKTGFGGYFFDYRKKIIFDFQNIDFIRFFTRTIFFINGFDLNMLNISSNKPI